MSNPMTEAEHDQRCGSNMTPTDDRLCSAFLQGSKWWEYHKTGWTMWQSDQSLAMDEAERRAKNGTLGASEDELMDGARK